MASAHQKTKFNADIQLKKPGKSKAMKCLKFKLPKKDITMADTLMSEFSHLGLSSEEKNKLSRNHREYFCSFKFLKEKDIKKMTNELISSLSQLKNEPLIICASEAGVYICLAAIFSGKLPQNVEWRFELEEFALPLFPKELVKKSSAADSYDISFRFDEKGYIKPFPSLKRAPSYMGTLGEDYDIGDFRDYDERPRRHRSAA